MTNYKTRKRVVLLRTARPTDKGSMSGFARMVADALQGSACFAAQTCDLFAPVAGSMWHDHVWRCWHAGRILQRQDADLLHLLDGSMLAFVPRRLLPRMVVTVHDLIPWLQLQGQLPGKPSFAAAWIIRQSIDKLRFVAGVHAVSAHTAADVLTAAGRDAIVIQHATRIDTPASSYIRIPARFILHIGNNATYKNRSGVLQVFAKLAADNADLWLVMAGPPPTEALRSEAAKLGRVVFLDDVSDAEVAALYARAALLLFPSLYEGFGLPVREAQAAGCPVVCSSAASLPEVAGSAALLAAPDDLEGFAAHCRTLLTDPEHRARLVAKGKAWSAQYTLERFGAALEQFYETVC